MATTTNFGWETPDDTDLVKDGAAAIRTALGGVDTSFVDLKGGTTGQVLTKASNTDLDYSWTAVDPLVILDAKGDLISATAADTPARLAVGTNNQVLTADSSTSTGLKWATASSGAVTKIAAASFSGVSTVDIDSVFSATYDNYLVYIKAYSSVGDADLQVQLRFAGPSTRTSSYYGSAVKWGRTGTATSFGSDNASAFTISDRLTAASAYMDYINLQFNCMNTASQFPVIMGNGFVNTGSEAIILGATNSSATAYTGFRLLPSSGTITGNYYVYGVQN